MKQQTFKIGDQVWVYSCGSLSEGVVGAIADFLPDTYRLDAIRPEIVTKHSLWARPADAEALADQLETDARLLESDARNVREYIHAGEAKEIER